MYSVVFHSLGFGGFGQKMRPSHPWSAPIRLLLKDSKFYKRVPRHQSPSEVEPWHRPLKIIPTALLRARKTGSLLKIN